MRVSAVSLSILGLVSQALAIDPLVVKGSKWFNKNTGDQFFIKGVDYQPDITSTSEYRDPLADESGCTRDLPFLKDLGVNAIRVYQTEAYGDHDNCMQMLSKAGIYVMLDLSTPLESINRDSPSYDADLLGYFQSKVDAFSKYDNVFAFLAGNEVVNAANNTNSAAFVKASLRDIKAYIKSKGLSIPVGYAAADVADIRWQLQSYFDCESTDEQADFMGVNLYEWCGDSATFESSGYADIVKNFTSWDVPAVLTEYGCNAIKPRTFPEVATIYGSDMTGTFSGGFVYEYVEESNEYGLVSVSGNTGKKTADYDNFKKALAAVNPKGVSMSSYTPSGKEQSCPEVSKDNDWLASSTLPPTPSNATCECMMSTLSCISKITEFGKDVSSVFGTVCGSISCGDVTADGESGTYGKYSFCNTVQRVSWVMNAWYLHQRGVDGSCDFNGFATTTKPSLNSDSTCSDQKDSDSGSGGSSNGSSNGGSSKDSDGSSSSASTMTALSVGAAAIAVCAAVF
ncbi:Glucanosyltransferase-domain-containing protein [Coemansia spiralis]|nr:Glucanosyltransferase-domain-containing protein [Coemansia spiralis]